MPHIPKAICGQCNHEMSIEKNGVILEALVDEDRPYYKIAYDKYKCRKCGNEIYTGHAQMPLAHHHEPEYKRIQPDVPFTFQN